MSRSAIAFAVLLAHGCHGPDSESADESETTLTATVVSYEPAAEWDHFDDGTFATRDKLTLRVVGPEQQAGTTIQVAVPVSELPDDSPIRTVGTRLSFTLEHADRTSELAWGGVEDLTVVP